MRTVLSSRSVPLPRRRRHQRRHTVRLAIAAVALVPGVSLAPVAVAAPSTGTGNSAGDRGSAIAELSERPSAAAATGSAGSRAAATTGDPVTSTIAGGRTLSQIIGKGGPTLRSGSARQAKLSAAWVDQIAVDAARGTEPGTGANGHPQYPGSVVLAARNGVVVQTAAAGYQLRYADQSGTELPADQWLATTTDTMYDLASLSKLFTSIVAMQLVDRGQLDLDATVASYLPEFGQNNKQDITIRQLLTHTSGMPPDPSPGLWTYATRDEKVAAVYGTVLEQPPGTTYIYSDLSMITLQFVVEKLTGKSLDVLVREGITKPLKMSDTMYNPPANLKPRIAAEEYQATANRGLIWGEVHDENAWALGGVAGHAGVFSTAHDLAILCQMMLNGGSYGTARILSRQSVLDMLTDLADVPGPDGLGFEMYQHWYMGAMATPYSFGHTGFTGTTISVDPTTKSFVILLTNRVHPSRDWGSINTSRQAVANDLAMAVRVDPLRGKDSWFGGTADKTSATLTLPTTLPTGASMQFGLWYDTEPDFDFLHLEASTDGGATWTKVPFSLSGRNIDVNTPGSVSGYEGRQWLSATADLTAWSGPVQLRWTYATDNAYHGRGVYLDDVSIRAGHRLVFSDSRPKDAAAFVPVGWTTARQ